MRCPGFRFLHAGHLAPFVGHAGGPHFLGADGRAQTGRKTGGLAGGPGFADERGGVVGGEQDIQGEASGRPADRTGQFKERAVGIGKNAHHGVS